MTEQDMKKAAELFVRDGQKQYAKIMSMFPHNPRGLLQLLYVIHCLSDRIPGLHRHASNVSVLTSEWIQAGCPTDTEEFLTKLSGRFKGV